MSRDSNTILLRQQYTGEPRQAAHAFYQARGLYFGLVPDAADPQQQLLEAAVMHTLARPALPELRGPQATFGLRGVSPDVDRLVLWPAPEHLPHVLAQILPVRRDEGIAGVPGLRVRPPAGRTDTLLLARPGHRAHLSVRARRRDLAAAEQWVLDAGLEPLWTTSAPQRAESAAWDELAEHLPPEDRALWSRALRRIALRAKDPANWTQRPPSPAELEGPKPERIAARPVGPAGGPARGVIAVTTSRGQAGLGCTTVALALAAALARTGTKVALLGSGREDPNGLAYLLGDQLPPTGTFAELAPNLPGPGALDAMTLPTDPARAHTLITEAARTHDTVVLDAGMAFQLRHLVEHTDAVLALVAYQGEVWGHTENTARLMQFLDREFAFYAESLLEAEELGEDLDFDVYADDDPVDVDHWWSEYAYALLTTDGWPRLPGEKEADRLDSWRADFLTFLAPEGCLRHPATWDTVATVWAKRNRDRNLRGLDLDEATDDLTGYLDEADIKVVRHLSEPASVTNWLREQFDHLAEDGPTLLLARTPEDVDQHQLAEVREGLRARGIPDTLIWPELDDLRELHDDLTGLLEISGEALAAANHLALAAADRLAARKRTTA
ncbi:hypothetical protein AB0393_28090 [Streptomyces cyaneofuscatus]|uniref:hypothetical protein n=1 Tax=Streptomyces cyaneofuscatus TaxID=66883 RepID=UPI00344EFE3D